MKGLILFPQKCKWAPAKCENQKSERKKAGKGKGGNLVLEWHLISSGRGGE